MSQVERHQTLQQQRLDPDQQGRVPPCAAGPAAGGGILGPAPGGDAFSQVPFFSPELPQEFLQSPPDTPGGQTGPPFPPPQQQGRTGGLLAAEAAATSVPQTTPRAPGGLAQIRPPGSLPTAPDQAARCHPSDPVSASSLPSAAPRVPFASSSLPQPYANILADDGPGRKRSVNRDAGARTPLSDDIPASTDAPRLTPEAAGPSLPPSALAPSSELERQLSVSSDSPRGLLCGSHLEVKVRPKGGAPSRLAHFKLISY